MRIIRNIKEELLPHSIHHMKEMLTVCIMAVGLSVLLSCEKGNEREFNPNPKNPDELAGSIISCGQGSNYQRFFTEHFPDYDLVDFSPTDMLLAVQSGKADFGFVDSLELLALNLDRYGLEEKFTGFQRHEYSVLFSKEATEYCELFNRFMRDFKAKGSMSRLLERWMGADDAKRYLDTLALPTKGEKMVLALSVSRYPYTYFNEAGPTGFQIDMMNHFSAWSGIPIEYKVMDTSAILQGMAVGAVQCTMIPFVKTEERSRFVLFSEPYISDCGSCIGRKADSGNKAPFLTRLKESVNMNLIRENRWKMILNGLLVTIEISIYSIIASVLVGAGVCAMRLSRKRWLRSIAKAFINIIRRIPLLILLMLLLYVVFASLKMSPMLIATIGFALYFGAYFSESFRTGIESIPRGQWEAGYAMGFGTLTTFLKIILPQAILRIMPVFKGLMTTLIKSTSIVGYIAIFDMTKASDMIRSRTFDAFFPLILVAVLYLMLIWLFGFVLDIIKYRLTPKHRAI